MVVISPCSPDSPKQQGTCKKTALRGTLSDDYKKGIPPRWKPPDPCKKNTRRVNPPAYVCLSELRKMSKRAEIQYNILFDDFSLR